MKSENSALYKRMIRNMALTVLIIFSVYSLILTPIYIETETNILFMIPILIDLMPYITDICELAGILVAYSYMIMAIKNFRLRKTLSFAYLFGGLTVYKYLIQLPVIYIMRRAPLEFADFIKSLLIPLLLEMAQLAIVLWIANTILKRIDEFISEKKSLEGKLVDYKFDEEKLFFPFVKLFNNDNPLQRVSFFTGIVIMASKMLQLLVIDFTVGLPKSLIDLFWIIASYTACVILGLASYLFILWMMMSIKKLEVKCKYE